MSLNLQDITEEQAVEAFSVCGALIGGYLWRLQHDSGGHPATLPFKPPSPGKKYLSAKEAAYELGIGRSTFYKRQDKNHPDFDPDFPKRKVTPRGERFVAAEILAYAKKLKSRKA